MSAKTVNLGKAYCKVELYDRMINLQYDKLKLRQPVSFVVATQPERNFRKECWGIQYLSVPGDQGGTQTAGIIPLPCYEPVNNFKYSNQSISTTERSVYWRVLSGTEISPLFKEIVDSNVSSSGSTSSTSIYDTSNQSWEATELPVDALVYREEEFVKSGFKYYGASGAPTVSGSTATGSTGAIVQPDSKSFICQQQSQAATWWGISTVNSFFMPGGAFWVNVIPTLTYSPNTDGTVKPCYISIKIAEFDNHHVLFTIDNQGRTLISYSWINANIPASSTNTGSTRYVPINLPSLSNALRQCLPFRVGFLIACGRIFIYCGQNSYDSVDINGPDPKQPPFVYQVPLGRSSAQVAREGKIQIYGYGCRANVNVCEMTFFKRSWFIVKNMDGNMRYNGYKSPVQDMVMGGQNVVAGTYSPGWLINWNIPRSQYIDNGNKPMWAGQFEYYLEDDTVSNPRIWYNLTSVVRTLSTVNQSNAPHCSTLAPGASYTPTNGALNWWGGIFVARVPGMPGIWVGNENTSSGGNAGGNSGGTSPVPPAPIWVCYLESYDWWEHNASNLIVHQRVRYPAVYNISGVVPLSPPVVYTAPQLNARNISDNIMNLEVSSSLDSAKPSFIIRKASFTVYDDGNFDVYLTRARGVKIWLKWSTSGSPTFTDNDLAFVGVAYGERASLQPGRKTVSFQCSDYSALLDRTRIKNSPFYDGFELFGVVKDLAERVGIVAENDIDHSGLPSAQPGSTTQTIGVPFYFLGSGFSFDKPAFRFEKSETIKQCLEKSINGYPVYLWFNNDGKLKMSVVPGDFDFSKVNPSYWHSGWDFSIKGWYYRSIGNITNVSPYKLILNEIQMNSNLKEGIYNSILMMGVERTSNVPIIVTEPNPASIQNPNSVGYLGYVSENVVQQPALDSQASVRAYMDMYKRMWSAPGFETSITTIGHIPTYTVTSGSTITTYQTRCGQFIQILQDITPSNDRFRITEISHKYDAEKNDWSTTIGAYQVTAPGLTPSSSS